VGEGFISISVGMGCMVGGWSDAKYVSNCGNHPFKGWPLIQGWSLTDEC